MHFYSTITKMYVAELTELLPIFFLTTKKETEGFSSKEFRQRFQTKTKKKTKNTLKNFHFI